MRDDDGFTSSREFAESAHRERHFFEVVANGVDVADGFVEEVATVGKEFACSVDVTIAQLVKKTCNLCFVLSSSLAGNSVE